MVVLRRGPSIGEIEEFNLLIRIITAESAEPVEICISAEGLRPTPLPNECSGCDIKLFDGKECGVTLHCHYSQVYSDSEWEYLIGSY